MYFTEHQFFKYSAIWFAITVFWAFAPSFYLLEIYDEYDPIPLHIIIHGVIFTLWIMIYAIQVLLIESKNIAMHKSIGLIGIIVMLLMIPSGLFPVLFKFYSNMTSIDGAGHNVFRLLSAYILFAFAIKYRRKPFIHKRLILGSMVMLMSAVIFRISFDLDLERSQIFNKGLQIFPAISLFLFAYLVP
jgi:hypothetical protein